MNADPIIGWPGINWIVPVRSREAYAATDDGRVLVWDGNKWSFPGSYVPGKASLGGMAVDVSTNPATVFVITNDSVYVSRNGTRTWKAAMQGLSRSLECTNVHFMIDHHGVSHLHLSTFRRSTWIADRVSSN